MGNQVGDLWPVARKGETDGYWIFLTRQDNAIAKPYQEHKVNPDLRLFTSQSQVGWIERSETQQNHS